MSSEANYAFGHRLASYSTPSVADAYGNSKSINLIFSSHSVVDESEQILTHNVHGELSAEQHDRVARPYLFLGEDAIYATEILLRSDDGVAVERSYRIWKYENAAPLPQQFDPEGVVVNQNVADYVATAPDDEHLLLDLELRDFPEWDIPLAPDALTMSPIDVSLAEERRQQAIDLRKEFFEQEARDLIEHIHRSHGRVIATWWKPGWISVELPAREFHALLERNDIFRIDGPYGKFGGPNTRWHDEMRSDAHIDAQQHIDAGYTGEQSNPSRHTWGDITVAITEPDGFEDGACGFRDGVGCASSTRIAATYRCYDADSDGDYCEPGIVDTNSSANVLENHGTAVTSVILADYTQGQANGAAVGDGTWSNSSCTSGSQCASGICESGQCAHSAAWEEQRTGMAPEARAFLFGRVRPGSEHLSFADMFDDAIDLSADIINASWAWGDLNCDMRADSILDQEAEIAFDDGILLTFSAGNMDGHNATSCTIIDPADTPKALVINAYNADTNDCANHPSTRCLLDRTTNCGTPGVSCSSRGGATANVVNVGNVNDAVRLVDLVAPNNVNGATYATSGSQGSAGGSFVGTSAAAPYVAGAAALVKDWLIDAGQTWINLPGYLHVMMLAMGDRHRSNTPSSGSTWTDQITLTPNYWYGLGRVRLRLFEVGFGLAPWGLSVTTYTQATAGTIRYNPFGTGGLPSGIELIKCTSNQIEDMSGATTNVSEFALSVHLRPNTGGSCSGTPVYTRTSDNYDLKKVVAFEGGSYTNLCVETELNWENVTTRGLSVQTVCYFAGINDDE